MKTSERLVIVGGSLAGLRACVAARRQGFDGKITLIGAEAHPPYDRPPLSKAFLGSDDEALPPWLPEAAMLEDQYSVELRFGEPATRLDLAAQTVQTSRESVPYDALLIATGATARTLPGTEGIDGVHTLRTLEDAQHVRAALDAGARTVIIGAGFIGAEIASAARKRGLDVTILEAQSTPLVRAVGAVAGEALAALHRRNGSDLRCGVVVEEVTGSSTVSAVLLSDGTEIPADLVIVGIGAFPATGWLNDSGLVLENGVVCDAMLSAAPNVWAAGDVARWMSPDFGTLLRLEHWTNASEQAAHAVRNILDPAAATAYSHIPYFWSDWYGSRIQFSGVPWGEPQIVSGAWDAPAFAALYRDGNRVVGALTLNRRADIMKYRALIARSASWDEALQLAELRNAA